jgi:hypothetical protein
MAQQTTRAKGSCLCGGVTYQVTGPLQAAVACHCGQCRKQSGHYLAAAAARSEDFKLIRHGSLKWYRASDSARRGFCGECGATLFWEADGKDEISIAAGTLDGATGLETAAHIFVADKGDYYDIADGLPQFPQDRPDVPLPD